MRNGWTRLTTRNGELIGELNGKTLAVYDYMAVLPNNTDTTNTMAIVATQKSSAPRQLPPAGTHLARCYQIIDLGTHDKEWQGKKRKSHEIRVSWELPNETADFGKGHQEPFAVHKTYTLSLSEKSNLRHDLQCWRGRDFTEQELAAFDVAKLLGKTCMTTVTHVEKNGSTYANVTAVTSVPKGLPDAPQVNPSVEYSIGDDGENAKFSALPDFLKEMIRTSDEWKSMKTPAHQPADNDGYDTETGLPTPDGDDW
jgi:hypothetical protein